MIQEYESLNIPSSTHESPTQIVHVFPCITSAQSPGPCSLIYFDNQKNAPKYKTTPVPMALEPYKLLSVTTWNLSPTDHASYDAYKFHIKQRADRTIGITSHIQPDYLRYDGVRMVTVVISGLAQLYLDEDHPPRGTVRVIGNLRYTVLMPRYAPRENGWVMLVYIHNTRT